MLILDGTAGSDICAFLARLQEETLSCSLILYEDWLKEYSTCSAHDHEDLEGIIYLRVSPEIAFKRLQKNSTNAQPAMHIEDIQKIYTEKETFFIENKDNPEELKNLPVLVLNGNIDFKADFAQFYNHLFYIRRFIKQIEERKENALGIHKEKAPHHKCC